MTPHDEGFELQAPSSVPVGLHGNEDLDEDQNQQQQAVGRILECQEGRR
jgi:hypothetical protein